MWRILMLMVAALGLLALPVTPRVGAAEPGAWRPILTVPTDYLSDATFASPDVAWVAGLGGIFRSGDGGRSWETVLDVDSFGGYDSIAAAPDGQHGWAVGGLGLIATTADGGLTWTTQRIGGSALAGRGASPTAGNVNLLSVAAIDNDSAMAVGIDSGYSDAIVEGPKVHIVLRTDDAGATWREVHIDPDYELSSVDFLPDGKHGWMSGSRCVPVTDPNAGYGCSAHEHALFASDDAGATWHLVNTTEPLRRLSFVTERAGWAVAGPCAGPAACSSAVARTDDGGKTWTELHPATGTNGTIPTVMGRDGASATAVEVSGQVTRLLATADGGASWQTAAEQTNYAPALALDGSRGVWLGTATPQWTADGANWHDAAFPVTTGSGAFDFVDAAHGWFAGSRLMRTADGGQTWAAVSDERLASVDFVSAREGWGARFPCSAQACDTATVLHTTDGGATWSEQTQSAFVNPPVVTFVDARNGWTYSPSDGKLLRTRDGAATWYEQRAPFNSDGANRGAVRIVDARTLVAAGMTCEVGYANCVEHIFASTDGGDTWTERGTFGDAGGGCGFFSIAATDASHIWATTTRCQLATTQTLHATADGGRTWSASDLPATAQFIALEFFSARVGRGIWRACGTESCSLQLARSSDGGATWATEALPSAIDYGGSDEVRFISPEHAFMRTNLGGGLFIGAQQRLWAYGGTEAVLDIPPITVPDTGSGTTPASSRGAGMFALALMFAGAIAVAGGTRVRRRR